ncbi:MAG: DUF177 domain-containing protein [Bacteriovoracaceae bacterium]|nr:DUF177 domain-containing protein [Bacteriovoracaceae bacterium]
MKNPIVNIFIPHGSLKVNGLVQNQEAALTFSNSDVSWVQEILQILRANVEDEDISSPQTEHLSIDLRALKKENKEFREHVIIQGDITASFYVPCVRCLMPTFTKVHSIFQACFLHGALENYPEYRDTTHIFCNNQEMELYFFNKGSIELKELISEQLHLVTDPLPLHSEDCKGLCQVCGQNLNIKTCVHNH